MTAELAMINLFPLMNYHLHQIRIAKGILDRMLAGAFMFTRSLLKLVKKYHWKEQDEFFKNFEKELKSEKDDIQGGT